RRRHTRWPRDWSSDVCSSDLIRWPAGALAATGEPMPYLPVSATIQGAKPPARTVKLAPMVGGRGFHYGADVTLPAGTTKITVAIGKPTIAVMPSAGRPARPATSEIGRAHV